MTGSGAALYCGIDIGAAATKLVLLDAEGVLLGHAVQASGVDYEATANACLRTVLGELGADVSQVARTVSTGYGRRNVDFADAALTELHCHGVGCYHHFRRAISIVDIGGQDNKVIYIDADGQRIDFKMNRKCAAGTGSFIEEIALRLALPVEELEPLAASATASVKLSSFCTVFAKTEILAHLRQGAAVADIVRGAFESVVTRVLEMDPLKGEVVLTGGVVAHNPTVAEILAARLEREVLIPPQPQLTGALGAALTAIQQEKNT